jgi:hypothetical protein
VFAANRGTSHFKNTVYVLVLHNVYADLSIDILYFGPWHNFDLGRFWSWVFGDTWERQASNPPVKADLESVQRVGIKYIEGWQEYDDTYGEFRKVGGDGLRRQLAKFKSLREVLLSDGDSEILFVTSRARLL